MVIVLYNYVVNGKDVRTSVDGSVVRKELGQLRDKVNSIIDTLDNQVSGGGLIIDSTVETIHLSEGQLPVISNNNY